MNVLRIVIGHYCSGGDDAAICDYRCSYGDDARIVQGLKGL
jgi:hypothetical protein